MNFLDLRVTVETSKNRRSLEAWGWVSILEHLTHGAGHESKGINNLDTALRKQRGT
jgi:hypothetical protein